jgi:uncharacterized protein YjbI with pentapeptide repeats
MVTKIIGDKIAEARKKLNISQAELAQRLFISPQAVGKWERGESMPDIITFSRLAEILNVDLNYFSENFQSTTTENTPTENGNIQIPSSTKQPETTKKKPFWNMSEGNWVDADFSGLKNLQDKFSSSNMKNCKFVDADLSKILLRSNNVEDCDFSNSDISSSQIQHSNLGKNAYKNCSLKETEFLKCNIEDCDFSDADFTKSTFKLTNFGKNTIKNAIINNTKFVESNLQDIVFEGVIADCYFENCTFYNVKFENAVLRNTFFKNNKRLKKVQFRNCKTDTLTYAFLKNNQADLTGVVMEEG